MKAEEILKGINNVEWDSEGNPLYSYDQVIQAINTATLQQREGELKNVNAEALAEVVLNMRDYNLRATQFIESKYVFSKRTMISAMENVLQICRNNIQQREVQSEEGIRCIKCNNVMGDNYAKHFTICDNCWKPTARKVFDNL